MRRADLAGTYGTAWEYRDDEHRGVEPWRVAASMGSWLVHCPMAHPFWSWHVIGGIHLRPHPDEDEPVKFQFPGATHEIYSLALDPRHDAALDPDDARTWHYLTPPDVAQQVILADDAQARDLVRMCATGCVHGVLIPDSDYRSAWAASLLQTSEHLGGHPDQETA